MLQVTAHRGGKDQDRPVEVVVKVTGVEELPERALTRRSRTLRPFMSEKERDTSPSSSVMRVTRREPAPYQAFPDTMSPASVTSRQRSMGEAEEAELHRYSVEMDGVEPSGRAFEGREAETGLPAGAAS